MKRATAVLLLAACAVHVPARAQIDPVFDGVWDGQLDVAAIYGVVDAKTYMPNTRKVVQIRMRGSIVSVRVDGSPVDLHDGFRIEKHDAAASIHGLDATLERLETWQISLTKTDAETLLGFVWRVVNNKNMHPGVDRSKVAWGGVIELKRARVPRPPRD